MTNINVVSIDSVPARTRSNTAGKRSSPLIKSVLELQEGQALEIVFDPATEPPVNTEKGETRQATFADFCNRKASVVARKGAIPFDYTTQRVPEKNRFYIKRPKAVVKEA